MNTPFRNPEAGRRPVRFRAAASSAVRPCVRSANICGVLALGLAVVAGSPLAHADTQTWLGNTDVNLATAANWDVNAVPAASDILAFGVAGTSGTALNNDLGVSVNLLFNDGASAYTFGGATMALSGSGLITNDSTSTQTFDSAVSTGNGNFKATAGALMFNGNVVWGANGTLTLSGASGVTFASAAGGSVLTLGSGLTGVLDVTGTTTVNGGSNQFGGVINVGVGNSSGNGTINIGASGSLSVLGSTHATNKQNSLLGSSSGTGVMNVNGGSVDIGGNTGLVLGNNTNSTGVLNLNSGTVTINAGTYTNAADKDFSAIMLGKDATSASGTINLNGGVLATDRVFLRGRGNTSNANLGSAIFNFNGGTLKALSAQSDWLRSSGSYALTAVTVKAGGAKIDTNTFDVAINNVLAHDTGVTTDGGLTKLGAGKLTLGGVNTYNGATTISDGTLAMGVNNAFGATNFVFNGGALDVGTFTNAAVGTLSLTANSAITLGEGGAFAFADSSLLDWGSSTLSISGTFVDGFSIRFGSDANALTGEQLALISINGGAATLDGSGYLIAAIPEPSAYAAFAGVLALGAVALRRRRQAQAL